MNTTRKIEKLRKLHKQSRRSRDPKAQFPYLEKVYEFYSELRAKRQALPTSRKIAKTFNIDVRSDSHPIAIIIKASLSNKTDQAVNRWTQCLRQAWADRNSWSDFESYLKEQGGIRGCAEKFANANFGDRYTRSD